MLNYQHSSFFKTRERAVLPGSVIGEEGVSLVFTKEGANGDLEVKPSTGAADEVFAGFAISTNTPATQAPAVEESEEAGATYALNRIPVAGQLLVKLDGTAATLAAGAVAPSAAGTVNVDAHGVLYFHADDEALPLFVQYSYELSASEASAITGDYYGGSHNTASRVHNSVGAVSEGVISTDMFDASADFSQTIHPRLGPNGMLTTSGTGTLLTSVIVKNSPSVESAFLELEVNL